MQDLNRTLRKIGNRNIVNNDIINLPDRNIDNIIINCYSNLKNAKLVAYSIDYSDNSTEFRCEYKAQIDKMRSKYKKGKKDEASKEASYEDMLNIFDTSEFINVDNIHNNFKILKLMYIVDPKSYSMDPNFGLELVNKTLDNWNRITSQYQVINNDTKEYLKYLKDQYKKEAATSHIVSNFDPMSIVDLYTKEQMVLVPIYDDDSKYVINGIKYYGVFNNCDIGLVTKHGNFSFKVFKNGSIYTMYLKEDNGVLLCSHFGNWSNLFHILTIEDAVSTPMEKVFPKTDNEYLNQLFKNTYEHAKWVETNDPKLHGPGSPMLRDKIVLPDTSKESHARATFGDKSYVRQVTDAVMEYIKIKENPALIRSRHFEFLGKLEDEIYQEINGRGRAKSKLKKIDDIIALKNRVNLSPTTVLSVIKKGTGDNVNNLLFTSTSTEPNPFDIYYVFAFMKVSNHTQTRSNKNKQAPALLERERWISWTDTEYLGEFAPKSESNIGRATTLKFSIDSSCIIKRRSLSK